MINTVSITACILTMFISWLISQGRLKVVYILGMFNGCLYCVLNAAIATQPNQAGVAFLIIPSVWGIAMSIYGLRRLRKEKSCSREP